MTTDVSIFDRPIEVPEELSRRAAEKGWPDALLMRMLELRVARIDIDFWLDDERPDSQERCTAGLDRREQLMFGTMRVREATWTDDEPLADLYANAAERIGDWEVTVERSPYPFAQFRLQEHPNIQVLEDRGIFFAVGAHSGRNTIVDGKRVSTHIPSAWRVRNGFRGKGYSNLLRSSGGPACAWFGIVTYYYVRSGNVGADAWLKALRPDMAVDDAGGNGKQPGRPVTVYHIKARPFDDDATGIRGGRRSDTRRCIALINRTHRGLDFFRPYSEEFLQQRLDDPAWGPKPTFWASVYTWDDYFVLEEEGRIVACAGLWDHGKNIRERWLNTKDGERFVVDRTALMDFGFSEGREDAMVRLIEFLLGRTQELGRDELMAPVEQLPAVVERLAPFEPATEIRELRVDPEQGEGIDLDVNVRKPYTDLAYW